MKEYIDLAAKVLGLLAATISLVVAIIAYQNSNRAREASTSNEASINSLSGKLSKAEAGLIGLKDETQSLQGLITQIQKTQAGLMVASPSEPVVLPELIVPGINGITYADHAHQLIQVRDGFLTNNFSGYPDLLISVRRLLDGRCPIGNPVPLTILNEKYLGNTSQPVMTHDMSRIRDAYVAAWRDKNMASAIQDFESMAPRCQNR